MLPYDALRLIVQHVSYEDLPAWVQTNKYWRAFLRPRLHTVHYPMHSLKRLCASTKEVELHANFEGVVRDLRVLGNNFSVTGIFRHCSLESCVLHEVVIVDCVVLGGAIRNGQAWFNVQTDGVCRLENVAIEYNRKGLINMGTLTLDHCHIEYNTTGIESRGQISMDNCTVRHNSVGLHITGRVRLGDEMSMSENTVNLLRTQPNRPLQRCWTQ